jgi:soluble lytic murein transglycosylase-like protein
MPTLGSPNPLDGFIAQLMNGRFAQQSAPTFGSSSPSGPSMLDQILGGYSNQRVANKAAYGQTTAGKVTNAVNSAANTIKTTTDNIQTSLSTGTPYSTEIQQAAAAYGVPAPVLQAIADIESTFNPNAVSSTGAQGLMQLMPATASSYGVNNAFDPQQNINGGAQYLRDLQKQFGNWSDAALHYFVGPNGNPDAADPSGTTGLTYRDKFNKALEKYNKPSNGALPQFGNPTIPAEQASYVCGPIAAQALASFYGRNIPIDKVIQAAQQNGLSPAGMGGPANEVRTIWSLDPSLNNVYNHDFNNDWSPAQNAVQNGKPVIISTPDHYYYATQYDPNRGFYVGNTGANGKRGGSEWMTPAIIAQLSGNPNGFIWRE